MYKISNTVGRRGVNRQVDVRTVQALLNRHIVPPSRLLVVDGLADSGTFFWQLCDPSLFYSSESGGDR